jgi:hypothetical protein
MKKIFALLIALAIMISTSVVYAEGTKLFSQQVTLYSAVVGTTAATTATAFTFDSPVKNIACDLISSPSTTTANTSFILYGNQGSSTTLFDSTAYITTATLASSLTLTVMKTVNSQSGVHFPVRTISAVVTATSTTQRITLNCTGIQ